MEIEPRPQGYRNRKLTPEQVREIRTDPMMDRRGVLRLAVKYGVHQKTIWKIRARKVYRDVE